MDGKLVFADFLSLVLPLDNTKDRMETISREIYPIQDKDRLPQSIEYNLTELIKKEIEYNEAVKIEKQKLTNLYDYRIEAAFKTIDKKQTRYLTFDSLYEFLLKMKVGVMEEDVIAFIRRVDCDLDRKISFNEFTNIVAVNIPKTKHKPSYMSPTTSFQVSMTKYLPNAANTERSKFDKPLKKTNTRLKDISMIHKKNLLTHGFPKKALTSRKNFKSSLAPSARTSFKGSLSSTKRAVKDKLTVYEVMEEHLDMERRLELMKQDLVAQEDISLAKIYQILDPKGNGYTKALDFLDILRTLKLNPDRTACYLLFDRFDRDLDGKWEYEDIKELINPIKKDYKEIIDTNEEGKKRLGKDSLVLLNRLLKTYLEMELRNSVNKSKVEKADVKKMFEEFDMKGEGFFTLESVSARND